TVNIHEAKTHLSRLLERVRRGDTITIARAGEPVALLVPIGQAPAARRVREPGAVPADRAADRRTRLTRLLEDEIWPGLPPDQAGRSLTRAEEDAILGYGDAGT
ncbi:MAG TPA: type II toxin-antitoxin system prevent-host-death family antitoxin, partial [Gemmatimonadales bacterium]|nr:type II toxin-antitoxin system prevent-host-death family antitoxin [Gemmatimonadales bacterium]